MRLASALRLLATMALAAAPAGAQIVPDSPVDSTPDYQIRPAAAQMLRALAGASLFYVAPRGDFAEHVQRGIGYSIAGSYAGDSLGVFAIRGEWQHLVYGHATPSDSTIDNVIRTLDVGPQLMLPTGAVRPYVSAAVGLTYANTQGSEPCRRTWCDDDDEDGVDDRESFTLLGRVSFSVARAAGVLFRVAKASATRPALWLDVRLSQRNNGETEYGTGGSAQRPVRGRIEYRMLHVGLTTGMR